MRVTKVQKVKSKEKIPAIREMRASGISIANVALEFGVASSFVCNHCKDIKVDVKRHRNDKSKISENSIRCNTYKINELSPEDKKRYLSLIPPKKDEEKATFITGRKDEYSKAAIFVDSRRGNVSCM